MNQFSYLYDEEVVLPLTRYQLGNWFDYFYDFELKLRFTRFELWLWLAFAMSFILRMVLNSERCKPRKKKVLNFMQPTSSRSQVHQVMDEDAKKLRMEAITRKHQ